MSEITKLDLYAILGVSPDATEKEILKSYRKKALKCHPDKNPDNPKAAEEFHKLSQALEVLTDKKARDAYDTVLKAKKAAELRNRVLDSKRKKFKDDLEAREKAAFEDGAKKTPDLSSAEKLEAEIKRLQEEGSRLLEEEQAKIREEIKNRRDVSNDAEDDSRDFSIPQGARLKVKWKAKKSDPDNGGYSSQFLCDALGKYGEVTVLVSHKKNGSAIVEFKSSHSAMLAVQGEIGKPENPMTLTWLSGEPSSDMQSSKEETPTYTQDNFSDPLSSSDRDFESIVLMRLRQAEERKRLIAQIEEEDKAG